MPMDHMAYGWANPVLSFVFSFLGSLLALMLVVRARDRTGRGRVRFLLAAALVLGSTGIWLMHFIAMLGFDVPALALRYDLPRTAMSLLLGVLVVAFGLLLVGLRPPSAWRILVGGPLTGLGIVGMHYAGMSAINVGGVISYERGAVIGSAVAGVVAATLALLLAATVRSAGALVIAAFGIALAASAMHYIGMAAVRVAPSEVVRELPGVTPVSLLVPIVLLACLLLVALFYNMAGSSINAESALGAGPARAPAILEPGGGHRRSARPGSR